MCNNIIIYFCQSFSGSWSQFSSVAYVWGAGDGGQLGTGTQECGLVPIKLPVPGEVSTQVYH